MNSLPRFVFPVLYATGVLLIALGIPPYRGRVPRNLLYGFRVAATLSDDRIWYPINARAGRDMIAIGAGYMVVLTVAAIFGGAWPPVLRILVPVNVLVAALLVDVVVLWRAAERLRRFVAVQTLRDHGSRA